MYVDGDDGGDTRVRKSILVVRVWRQCSYCDGGATRTAYGGSYGKSGWGVGTCSGSGKREKARNASASMAVSAEAQRAVHRLATNQI